MTRRRRRRFDLALAIGYGACALAYPPGVWGWLEFAAAVAMTAYMIERCKGGR